jgi:hypothetical protein
MTLQLLHSEFPYIQYEENLIFFFYQSRALHMIHLRRKRINFMFSLMKARNLMRALGEERSYTLHLES